jgi:hypothetical protein
MKKIIVIALSLLFAAPAFADELADNKAEARSVADAFRKQLGGELQKEMKANGPVSSIRVCTKIAPEIASRISREKGWQVTRVSLKVRNPLLGSADAWQQKVLADFDKRAAAGDKPDTLEVAEIVSEPGGKFFRYLSAIPVAPVCLNCHGPADKIADDVKASLARDYPFDKATGYSEGQIRGAISIRRPL